MTLKKCKRCNYKQQLNDDRKMKKKWRCYDCGMWNKLSLIIIGMVLSIGSLGVVYSEEVNLPVEQPYDESYCTFLAIDGHVIFTCSWKWFLPDYVMEEVDHLDIPEKISEIPQHNLDLADQIRLLLEKGEPPKDPMDLDFEEFLEPEEPLTFEQKQIEIALTKLDECRTGLGAYAAFQEQEAIQHYVNASRYSFGTGQTGAEEHQLMKIKKAIEECRIMDKGARAGTVSPAHYNAYLADSAGVDYLGRSQTPTGYNATDSPYTDPVTEKDIAKEIEAAERYLLNAPFMNPNIGCLPTEADPDRCINRGGQPEGLKCQTVGQPAEVGVFAERVCPLDDYNQWIIDNFDTISMLDILNKMCDTYLGMYKHMDEIPVWLSHCPIEDKE